MRIERSLAVVVGAATALIVAGAVVALLSARQPETNFPAGSPEATVAEYLRFLQGGDVDGAFALTSITFESGPLRTRESFNSWATRWSQTSHRVSLISSKTNGDRATVVVEIATFQPDAFGGGDRTSRQTFSLVRSDSAWRITSPIGLF